MTWSPTAKPSRPGAANGCTTSQASGAPSEPCFGALLRSFRFERITPIDRISSDGSGLAFPPARKFFLAQIMIPDQLQYSYYRLAPRHSISKFINVYVLDRPRSK